jgi:hypothetical protein
MMIIIIIIIIIILLVFELIHFTYVFQYVMYITTEFATFLQFKFRFLTHFSLGKT